MSLYIGCSPRVDICKKLRRLEPSALSDIDFIIDSYLTADTGDKEPGHANPSSCIVIDFHSKRIITDPPQILVVDDDEILCDQMREIISTWALRSQVICVNNATDALTNLKSNKINLAFFDIHLPDMNGAQLLEKALKIRPELKCWIISGTAEVETVFKTGQLGAQGYVAKPFKPESIIKIVQENC